MRYIEAPNTIPPENLGVSVFLAGGITGCPDWQSEIVAMLDGEGYTLLNPRRENFPMDDPTAARSQIVWEHAHLRIADIILFWFPKETLCPIALYELGAWSKTNKPMCVGVEPGYERALDIVIQTDLIRPDIVIADNLQGLVEDLLQL